MKNRKETFEKISKGSDKGKFKRILVQEEIVTIDEEQLDRMERNANNQILVSEQIIADMRQKLEECARLRELL